MGPTAPLDLVRRLQPQQQQQLPPDSGQEAAEAQEHQEQEEQAEQQEQERELQRGPQPISKHQERLHASRQPFGAPHPAMNNSQGLADLGRPQIELAPAGGRLVGARWPAGGGADFLAGLQSGHLTQLALLSGALLALILLTLLLARRLLAGAGCAGRRPAGPLAKLRPSSSYHWMLAKQTRRQERPTGSAGHRRHLCSAESSSSGDTTSTTLVRPECGPQLQPAPAPAPAQRPMWHIWPRQEAAGSRSLGQPAAKRRPAQCLVDAQGRHRLAPPAGLFAGCGRPDYALAVSVAGKACQLELARALSAAAGPASSGPDTGSSSSSSSSAGSLSAQSTTAQLVSASQSQANESSFELPPGEPLGRPGLATRGHSRAAPHFRGADECHLYEEITR